MTNNSFAKQPGDQMQPRKPIDILGLLLGRNPQASGMRQGFFSQKSSFPASEDSFLLPTKAVAVKSEGLPQCAFNSSCNLSNPDNERNENSPKHLNQMLFLGKQLNGAQACGSNKSYKPEKESQQ